MGTPLKILMLEDNAADAELVLRELRRSGFDPAGDCVETEAEYVARLDPALDVILADYNLPQFDALRALHRLQERSLDVPFIVVSGTIGEELAVAAVRLGAADYLLKDRLGRLGEAVRRTLEERRLRLEKQRAEAALRASEEHYRSLVANIPDVTWRADVTGARLFVSPNVERVLGFTPAQVCDGGPSFWFDRVHPDDVTGVRDAYAALFGECRALDVDYRFRTEDGRWVWLHERAALVEDGDGVPYADGVSTDITARKQAEDALRQAKEAAETANRLKSEFLATVSHELRTPLTAILGFSQLLAGGRDGELSPRQAGHARRIVDSAQYLVRLIDGLLDVARIGAGRLEVTPAAIDLRPIVSHVRAHFGPQAEGKGLALEVDVPADLPQAWADPTRLRQVLHHLVDNAVKFTERGGVAISARADTDRVAVAVADTGIGIAPEALGYIFDEFRQADGSATRRFGGIGLGLPMARKLAQLLGGTIDVASELGVGSTFTLHLPLAGLADGRSSATASSDGRSPAAAPLGTAEGEGGRLVVVRPPGRDDHGERGGRA